MPHKTRRRRRHMGGSYTVPPIKSTDLKVPYDVNIVCAHGSITPEYYYVVPDNVLLILAQECGTKLNVLDSASHAMFETPENGNKMFEDQFIKGDVKLPTKYTVYVPGDILPLHGFSFNPMFSKSRQYVAGYLNDIGFGFVGVFKPGSLYDNSILAACDQYPGYTGNYFIFNKTGSKLERITARTEYDYKTFYNGILELANHLYTDNPELYGPILLDKLKWLKKPGTKNEDFLNNMYKLILTEFKYSGASYIDNPYLSDTLPTRDVLVKTYQELLPLIPENILSQDIIKENKIDYTLNELVNKIANPEKQNIFLINSCRSLHEPVAVSWNNKDVKPSSELVKIISNLGKNEEMRASVNMNTINNFRIKKGLEPIKKSVIRFDELLSILLETQGNYNVEKDKNSNISKIIPSIDTLIRVLQNYKLEHTYSVSNLETKSRKLSEEAVNKLTAEKEAAEKAEKERQKALIEFKIKRLQAKKRESKKKENKEKIQEEINALREQITVS